MPPRIIVVAGPPCAGKSTLAAQLSNSLDALRLSVDDARRRIMPESDQRMDDRDIAYRAMHMAAEFIAARCGTLILDATYARQSPRLDLVRTLKSTGAVLFLIECRIDADAAVARFRQRRGAHAAIDLTGRRVAALADTYPYFEDASITAGTTSDPSYVLARLSGPPLKPLDIRRWCTAGDVRTDRPRVQPCHR